MKLFKTGLISLAIVFVAVSSCSQRAGSESEKTKPEKLVVVWTSGDRDVAERMVFMYTNASKRNNWWDEVRFVVWGPSSKLLAEDEGLQKSLKEMQDAGVEVQACIVCADMYGVSDKLRELGIDVRGMGKPLTDMLQSGWVSLTF